MTNPFISGAKNSLSKQLTFKQFCNIKNTNTFAITKTIQKDKKRNFLTTVLDSRHLSGLNTVINLKRKLLDSDGLKTGPLDCHPSKKLKND